MSVLEVHAPPLHLSHLECLKGPFLGPFCSRSTQFLLDQFAENTASHITYQNSLYRALKKLRHRCQQLFCILTTKDWGHVVWAQWCPQISGWPGFSKSVFETYGNLGETGQWSQTGYIDQFSGQVLRRRRLLSKKNIAAHLNCVRGHVDKPYSYRKNVVVKSKVKISCLNYNH